MDRGGCLWVYKRGVAPSASTPKKAANRPDFYKLKHPNEQPMAAEQAIAEAECRIAPTVRKIGNPSFVPTPEHQDDLLIFVALTFVRVPAYLNFIEAQRNKWTKELAIRTAKDKAGFGETWASFRKNYQTDEDEETTRQFILRGEYVISQKNRDEVIGQMFRSMQTVANTLFRDFGCEVWEAPVGHHFLTSDNPVLTLRAQDGGGSATFGVGFGRPHTEVVMPLNKRCCLHLARNVSWRRLKIGVDQCEHVNRAVMGAATELAFGPIGTRRQGRLFDQFGCKMKYGENAFVAPGPF
jgi:hypothetical protein